MLPTRWLLWGALALILAGCSAPDGSAPGSADESPFTILWLGDTLLSDAAQPLLDREGYLAPFRDLVPLPEADYVVANLEGPLTIRSTPWDPNQRWSYQSDPAAAAALAAVGIDAVGLANNHSLDRGPQGLADTIATLAESGLSTFGAGGDQIEAASPLLIETPYGIVAVVGFGEDASRERLASRTTPGSLVPSYSAIQLGLDQSRGAGARWLVAFVHWGTNYQGIEDEQRRWAQRFADAGYDLVIGHGPHLAQPVEFVDGMLVLYSLGNFVFGTPGRYSEAVPGISVLAQTELTAAGFRTATLTCLLTDNRTVDFRPRPCDSSEAAAALASLQPDLDLVQAAASLRLADGSGVGR